MLLHVKPSLAVGVTFQVMVTEADWMAGEREQGSHCALAQALRRSGYEYPGVGEDSAGLGIPIRFYTSHDGRDLVRAFDAGHPFPGDTVVTFKVQA